MMLIPGANLLNMALTVINPQGLRWQRWVSRDRGPNGTFLNTYATPVNISGSAQSVDAKLYQVLGLDAAKTYITVFTTSRLQPPDRDRAADLITYNGKLYSVGSEQDWSGQDGWASFICVQVDTP